MKKYVIGAILVALTLLAGCQQRTDFDACIEYYEKNVRGKENLTTSLARDLKQDALWSACIGGT